MRVEGRGPGRRGRLRRVLGWAALGLLLGHLVVVLVAVFSIAWPNPLRLLRDYGQAGDYGLVAAKVETAEGLRGWFFEKEGAEAVVLVCHGRSMHKAYLLPLIERLAARWSVLAIDFRSHGDRGYGRTTIGWDEADDVAAALDYLEGAMPGPIAIYGVSMGGASVLHELSRRARPRVRAVAVDGTFDTLENTLFINARRRFLPDYVTRLTLGIVAWVAGYEPERVRPIDFAAKVDVPTLFVQGDEDTMVSPRAAERLARRMPGRATYRSYHGGHDLPANREMQDLVLKHFEGVLGN
jgi:uncharacterized protein